MKTPEIHIDINAAIGPHLPPEGTISTIPQGVGEGIDPNLRAYVGIAPRPNVNDQGTMTTLDIQRQVKVQMREQGNGATRNRTFAKALAKCLRLGS